VKPSSAYRKRKEKKKRKEKPVKALM